ncbi:RNA-binding protein 12B-like [Gouania willdenowi]|uniref:RNA-binding protein 12B-like n=1 Tax=Gouania willdenowi TaxID=441366 RepID=A0A8C5EGH5_GOUWI|nr:RNA-binding protein 12B-like [Gouania willdenowi]
MVVVIRLQGLRITAGSEDIRRFFTGLEIPAGGVHIIGGERGDAFIIFTSDEDARRAMVRSGGHIKGSTITLQLSSKAEMQKELEKSAKNITVDQKRTSVDTKKHTERSIDPVSSARSGSRSGYMSPQPQMDPEKDDSNCLFLRGLPYSVTETEILQFFRGLLVDDVVLLKNANGSNNGRGIVKFATAHDAKEGLKLNDAYIGTRYIAISRFVAKDSNPVFPSKPRMLNTNDRVDRGRPIAQIQNPPQQRLRSRSPLPQRQVPVKDYCVLLENLSFSVEKEDIKQLFRHASLEDDQILHLLDSGGRRSRSLVVLFKNSQDYSDALSRDGIEFHRRMVSIQPISREKMCTLMESQHQGGEPSESHDPRNSESVCVYVQNLPCDVRKAEVIDLFYQHSVSEDEVCVLHDHTGSGVGKALVLFKSEAEAMRALSLNGRRFLGSEVVLKIISRSQMQQLMADPPPRQDFSPGEEQFVGRSSNERFSGDFGNSGSRIQEDISMGKAQDHRQRVFEDDFNAIDTFVQHDWGNAVHGHFEVPERHFDNPTLVQLVNLPFSVTCQEIYDFCHGYCVIPGSVVVQQDKRGRPRGSAMVEFSSHQEALAAISELSGRPIGPRKIQLVFPFE